tara:strand:- start:16 stop:429 length:414 start_codon:yes stop_codon:yes gene_type:complete
MPIYEYLCKKCEAQFEVMQAISAKPLKNCEVDGCKGKVERLVSASGFILKGSGWYSSDYPSEARKKGWESEQKAATGTVSSDDKGHSCGSGCDHGTPSTKTASETEGPVTKPAATKPKTKNPYYSGKSKPPKSAKTS